MASKVKKDNPIHHDWAVAYIDLLGQREAMRAVDFEPVQTDEEQVARFKAAVDQSYGAMGRLHAIFDLTDRAYTDASTRLFQDIDKALLPGTWRPAPAPPRRFQRFSDGLVIYLPLDELSPITGLYYMLESCATALLVLLATGNPIRGGIEIGRGQEKHGSELYGPIMGKAYELESQIAQYPRIVVGQGCLDYIDSILQRPYLLSDWPRQVDDRNRVQQCQGLLAQDLDGHTYINFLGEQVQQKIGDDADVCQLVFDAYQFVLDQQQEHRKKRNTKLAFRYARLRQYFEEHIPQWERGVAPHAEIPAAMGSAVTVTAGIDAPSAAPAEAADGNQNASASGRGHINAR